MAWWWPFSKKKKESSEKAEAHFRSQLEEALLRQDDLKEAARQLKEDRVRRLEQTQNRIRPKIDSQTQTS